MTKNILGVCLSQLSLWTKILLVLVIIVMGAAFFFILRIHQGPIDLAVVKPQIEKALSDIEEDRKVTIGNLALTWPSLTAPILFNVKDVHINQKEQEGLSVSSAAFSISSLGLLKGKIIPNYVLIERPVIHLVQKDGAFRFFWQKEKTSGDEEINPKEARNDLKSFLKKLTSSEDNSSIFSNLEEIELKQAVIKAENIQSQEEDYLAVVTLKLEKNNLGLQGYMDAVMAGSEGETANLKSDIIYRSKQEDITFSSALENFNPAGFSRFLGEELAFTQQDLQLSGTVQAAFDNNLKLQIAMIDVNMPAGEISFSELSDTPIPLKDIIFKGYINRPDQILDIEKFEATINDISLSATAKGKIEKGKITAPVELKIPDLPINNIAPIFPKSQLDSSAGEWLTEKLSNGRAYDVVAKGNFQMIRDSETKKRDISFDGLRVDFKTEGVTVKYSDTLMPVTEAKGVGYYENDTLVIDGEYGKIGDIIGSSMILKMTDISVEGGGKANIDVVAKGPLKTALKYVSDEPIAVADKLGFDIEQTGGIVDFKMNLQFPTVKDLPKEEVIVILDGTVKELKLPEVVKGLDLTGGPYDLGFKDGAITLKGQGALGGYPAKVDWLQYLDSTGKEFESKISASVSADEKLRDIFGIGLEDYISGTIPVDVVYTDYGQKATIDVKGDLTPTALHIEPFAYDKKGGVEGNLSLKAYMTGEALTRIDQLSLQTKDFSLSNGKLSFQKLSDGSLDVAGGSFPNTKLGKNRLNIDFEVTNKNVLKIVADGPVADISAFLDKKPEEQSTAEEEKPMIISASVDRLLGDGGEGLDKAKIYIETNEVGDMTALEMDAKIGEGAMYIRFKPEEGTGKRSFRMESSDAGYTLKVFGLYDKMRGGKMTIYGVPQGKDLLGNLYGSARIDNFSVRSTPVLAKLLGAMSLTGIGNLLNNEGLRFGRLESDFEWQFREKGNFLVMKDGRTAGSSLGLTFDGNVNQETNQMNIRGTIVPLSGVNKVIGGIPVLGDLLTGGSGSLIATTYTVSGQANDPKVSVNPLSMLAPGFLRKIFFEGDVSSPASTAKEKPAQ